MSATPTAATPPARTMTGREWTLVLSLSVLWGGSFFFNGVAVRELPTFTMVVARVALGALALWAILRARGERMPRERGVWAAFLAMGLLNNVVPFSLIVWGQAHVASGVASILNATTPLFGVLVAHALTADEKLTRGRFMGVLVGFGGVAVLVGGAGVAGAGMALWGQAACLGGALAYAFAAVFGRRFRRMGLSPLQTATGQTAAASGVLIPLMLAVDRPWALAPPGPETLAALVGVALLSTALAYILYFLLISQALADLPFSGASNVNVDPLRLVEAVTAGVAFLSAGLIFSRNGSVQNVTTGASMWLAGAIGTACGVGQIGLAGLATLMVVIVLAVIGRLQSKLGPQARDSVPDEGSNVESDNVRHTRAQGLRDEGAMR